MLYRHSFCEVEFEVLKKNALGTYESRDDVLKDVSENEKRLEERQKKNQDPRTKTIDRHIDFISSF